MESITSFVAEWLSLEEMKVLQVVSVLTSVWAREWQYKDVLNDIDDLMWEDLSEEWQKKPVRGRRKSCLVKSALGPQEGPVQISRTGAQPRSVPASPRFQKKKKKRELP